MLFVCRPRARKRHGSPTSAVWYGMAYGRNWNKTMDDLQRESPITLFCALATTLTGIGKKRVLLGEII